MRVRMRTGISGTRNSRPWPAIGETIDLPDGEAEVMIAQGHAEPVEAVGEQPKRRGRPPGSKNKPKGEQAIADPGGERHD